MVVFVESTNKGDSAKAALVVAGVKDLILEEKVFEGNSYEDLDEQINQWSKIQINNFVSVIMENFLIKEEKE